MSNSVIGSSSTGSGSDSYNTFNPDMEMNMDNRSIVELNDNMVGSMDENNSNINNNATNISPRSQDNMFTGVEPEATRTTFSVDVPAFKSQLTNSFSQSDIGKVFTTDTPSYSANSDLDSFSGVMEVAQGYGQGFASSDPVNPYSQGFTASTNNSGVSYSQTFASNSEAYSANQPEMGSAFAQSNLNNMLQLKANGMEKSNICTVSTTE